MDEYNYLVALLEDDGSNSEQCVFMEQLLQSYYHYSIEPYMWETFNLVLYLKCLHRLYIKSYWIHQCFTIREETFKLAFQVSL